MHLPIKRWHLPDQNWKEHFGALPRQLDKEGFKLGSIGDGEDLSGNRANNPKKKKQNQAAQLQKKAKEPQDSSK